MMRLLPILVLLSLSSTPISEAGPTFHTRVSLISEHNSIQPGTDAVIALQMRLKPHWHVYWKNPGDSGMPTRVKWDLPKGFSASELSWPYPMKFELPPLTNYGYEKDHLLSATLKVPKSIRSKSVELKAKVSWLECKDICIPGKQDVSLTLPVSQDPPSIRSKNQRFFQDHRAKTPKRTSTLQIAFEETSDGLRLSVQGKSAIKDLHFFPENESLIKAGAEQKLSRRGDEWLLDLEKSDRFKSLPQHVRGVLVSSTGFGSRPSYPSALEVETKTDSGAQFTEILRILFLAFLGGMILNLMPCVFPVLSIKVLALIKKSEKDRKEIRNHSLLFSLGVILCFWGVALSLLLLRQGGELLGWGFQLQNPLVLAALATLFFLMSLSLLGVFEFGHFLTRLGGKFESAHGYLNSLGTGALAVIVATPCTGPFMATAIGYALSQPFYVSFLVFTALAIGMAVPYLMLSIQPSLLRVLPKPGRWMETLKQFMAFPLLATVVWLVWVFGFITGLNGVLQLMVGLLLLGFGAWIMGRWSNSDRRKWAHGGSAAIALLAGVILFQSSKERIDRAQASSSSASVGALEWENYDETKLAQYRSQGIPVFLDFTAAWCVTCKVNEKVVFSSSEVLEKLEKEEFVLMKADWTAQDPAITRKLAEFGRSGVPLYLVYGRDPSKPPIVLPEILTPGIVLKQLNRI